MELRHAFAETLRAVRSKRRLTQEDFVAVSSRTNVSLLERGKTVPTIDKLQQLCSVLDLHPVTVLALCYCRKDEVLAAALISQVQHEIAELAAESSASAEVSEAERPPPSMVG